MREKHLMHIFFGLNAALAGAFALYLLLSTDRHPKVLPAHSSGIAASQLAKSLPAPPAPWLGTNRVQRMVEPPIRTNAVPATVAESVPAVAAIAPINREITWRDLTSPDYKKYLENLRRSGCPESTVRRIVLDDIAALMADKRLQVAMANDPPWWKPESYYAMTSLPNVLQERARQLAEDQRDLITELLGSEAAETNQSELVFWTDVQLTGPVLGQLPPDRHRAVQLICRKSLERQNSAFQNKVSAGQSLSQVETARLREQTRAELRRELDPVQLEEFLLRYSHNASRLRDDLRGFAPTPEEFRQIFRATDSLDHAMQLEFGGPENMSPKQRERWEQQRDKAIEQALSPERYLAYRLSKDPLYRQAQVYVTQYGAPPQAVQPIYEMTKLVESKRQAILNDNRLSSQEKSQALQAVNLRRHEELQKIVAAARQTPGSSQ